MISKNMLSSPLGCCIPSGDRQNLNPVFKQQYITEGGHIKMKMPVSPMHYISNASFYAHDDRFPVRVDPGYPYYNERIHQNQRNMEYDLGAKNDPNKRLITPSMSFITQPRRNLSAQIINHGQNNQGQVNMNHILANINDKLTRIEFLCKNNEEDIKEIIQILKPKQEVKNNEEKNYQTRLINKEGILRNNNNINSNINEKILTQGNNIKLNMKYYESKDSSGINEKQKEKLMTHSLLNESTDIISKIDDKMFDVSEDLKNSNDMLEKYLRSVKFNEDMNSLENRLDILSGDYAIGNRMNQLGELESNRLNDIDIDKDMGKEDSIMSNIESKFRKLFSRFDTKSQDESQNESDEDIGIGNRSLNNNIKINNVNKNNLRTNSKNFINDQNKESMVIFDGSKKLDKSEKNKEYESNQRDESIKLLNNELILNNDNNIFNSSTPNINLKLSSIDMINILKGIDLPSKIREANLTMDELIFLQQLNNQNDSKTNVLNLKIRNTKNVDLNKNKEKNNKNNIDNNNPKIKDKEDKQKKDKKEQERGKENQDYQESKTNLDDTEKDRESISVISDGHPSTDTEHEFKCDMLAPTRVDFTPLLIDDSIHGLNSTTFD